MTSCLPGLLQPSHVLHQALARKANLGVQFTSAAGKPVNYKVNPGREDQEALVIATAFNERGSCPAHCRIVTL